MVSMVRKNRRLVERFATALAAWILAFSAALWIAWAVGTVTLVTGVVASFQADIPTGPLLVCMFGLAMFVGLLIRFVVRARPGSVMQP